VNVTEVGRLPLVTVFPFFGAVTFYREPLVGGWLTTPPFALRVAGWKRTSKSGLFSPSFVAAYFVKNGPMLSSL